MTEETLASINAEGQGEDVNQDQENPVAKGVPKLLAQRNALKVENEQLMQELQAMKEEMSQFIGNKFSERDRLEEKLNFAKTYGDENLATVESVVAKYPTLSYEDALKIAKPEEFVAKGQSIGMRGDIPKRVAQDKPLQELSKEELVALAEQELKANGYDWLYPTK